ncbi:hypothetical protein ABIA00_002410 [Bradyrhizobium ottawaense]
MKAALEELQALSKDGDTREAVITFAEQARNAERDRMTDSTNDTRNDD